VNGGGGGSSFVAVGATDVTSAASALTGDGQVTISYDPATDSCPTEPPATPTAPTTPTAAAPAAQPVTAVARFTG
jgi:hypothetical protein